MQTNLWQRRLVRFSPAAILLLCGAMTQSHVASADDNTYTLQPLSPGNGVESFRGLLAADDANPQNPVAFPAASSAREAFHYLQLLQQPPATDAGKYWLGVECREMPPELQSQLGLKEGEGLVVLQIIQDSPAAKAGLKQHDIILSLGDAKMAHPQELVKAVNAAEGKEISLKIIRGGKEQTVAATPLERPQVNLSVIARPNAGMVLPNFIAQRPQIPDNVSVSIMRQGNKPAKISVSRGDEKWEIDEHELNKLPDDVRPFVQGMLGGGPMTFNLSGVGNAGPGVAGPAGGNMQNAIVQALKAINGQPGPNGPANGIWVQQMQPSQPNPPPGAPQPPNAPRMQMNQQGPGSPDVMQRLEQIDRRLQQLQDEVRGLHDMRPDSNPRMREPGPPQNGNDGPQGPPGRGNRNGPPQDGERRGPPPRDDARQGSQE